eukprot:scaffold62521_cov59-Phaeocystis_antarctica.AAC.3
MHCVYTVCLTGEARLENIAGARRVQQGRQAGTDASAAQKRQVDDGQEGRQHSGVDHGAHHEQRDERRLAQRTLRLNSAN